MEYLIIALWGLLLYACFVIELYRKRWLKAREANTKLAEELCKRTEKDKALRKWIFSQKIRYDDMYEACLNDLEKWLDYYEKEEQI